MSSQNCRTCRKRLAYSWCTNKDCAEYVDELRTCGVTDCKLKTPYSLCRVHYNKNKHCTTCARKFNDEGFCTKCDFVVECVFDGCKSHVLWINDRTIPLCPEHFGTRICFEHKKCLADGVCPVCSKDDPPCLVLECDNPTRGYSLCKYHYTEGWWCTTCGRELDGEKEAVMFCVSCDDNWKCGKKECHKTIAAYDFCKACYTEAV